MCRFVNSFGINKYLMHGLLLALMTAMAPFLQADEELPDKMQLRVGGFFLADQSTDLLVRSNGLGATINIQELFKMKEQNQVFRLNGYYRFTPKHSVEFSWYSINNSSSTDGNVEFQWGDKNITAKAALDTHLNTDIYKINYVYSFYHSPEMEAGVDIGLHITKINIGFSGSYDVDGNVTDSTAESIKTTAPLPVIGFRFKYNISPALSVLYATDFFFITYEQVSGAMTDTLVSIDYRFTDHLGVGIGFNSTRMRLLDERDDNQEIYIQHDVAGGLAYATLTF